MRESSSSSTLRPDGCVALVSDTIGQTLPVLLGPPRPNQLGRPATPVAGRQTPAAAEGSTTMQIPGSHDGRPAGAAPASAIVGARGAGSRLRRGAVMPGVAHPWTGTAHDYESRRRPNRSAT